jgi:hypothetical protein
MPFEFDESLHAAVVGKYLLVGITCVDSQDKVLEKKESISPADAGEYRLRSTARW